MTVKKRSVVQNPNLQAPPAHAIMPMWSITTQPQNAPRRGTLDSLPGLFLLIQSPKLLSPPSLNTIFLGGVP